MGLAEILRSMEDKAAQQVAEREQAADKECRSIIDGAEAEALQLKKKQHAKVEEKLRREQERLFGAAQLDRQRQLAAAREHWLAQVLARARQHLADLRSGARYARGYDQLVRESMGEIASAVRFEIDPRDEPLMSGIMAALGIDGEIVLSLNTLGGLRVSSIDGCVSVDNTLEARLENGWRELRQHLAVLLTAEELACPATTATRMHASER